MAENEIRVRPDVLEAYLTELFTNAGLAAEDATFHAWALVQTNLWGVDSHGVLRAPTYLKRLGNGGTNPHPQIKRLKATQALEVLDGDDGPGFLVARTAMQRAIELAREHGIAAVGAIHSNHFGAAALYARMASEQGMVGIAMTNVIANIVAPGGSRPVVGNNPLAIAIPSYGEYPFVLDISMSAVSGGKLLLASKKGEQIPMDWATDRKGRPTSDPEVGFKGFFLPMAGHKGLALAYAIDMLSGLITGGAYLDLMKGMYGYPEDPSLTGHLLLALNLDLIISPQEMQSRMADYFHKVKASPMWAENAEMLLPGELEFRCAEERRLNGIPIPENLYQELLALGPQYGATSRLWKMVA
jgi:LDH2 family malate/lactate/ureidoglycolate dehydrogenase